ncbi:hypothetical protein MRS44_018755 [Fusarium solani]|uniref:uncharacterized protein n=1 Tax=Fusarium solani TaxID=169388 RepID=UPI0032C47F31|nr:hypothetical protein MRS44_018755 [Fusarium solani]
MDYEEIKNAVLRDGFFSVEDTVIGTRVDGFAREKYPFQTMHGLALLQATLDDERVRNTVESLLDRCGLGMFKVFGPHPDTARALLNRTTDKLLALTTILCPKASRLILFEDSHRHALAAEPGGTGQLELPRETMTERGFREKQIDLDEGGLVIIDGRLFTTVVQGAMLGIAFAVPEELGHWAKMPYPNSADLQNKVRTMDSERIQMNIKFVAAKRLK